LHRDKRIIIIALIAVAVTIGGIGILMIQQRADQVLKELSLEIVEMLEGGDQQSADQTDTNPDGGQPEGALEENKHSEILQDSEQRTSTSENLKSVSKNSTVTTTKKSTNSDDPSSEQQNTDSSKAAAADGLTLSDKSKAYTLATSKLSSTEIKNLMQWSKGGFTAEEKAQAKALFYSRFTAEEQRWILSLLSKYNS